MFSVFSNRVGAGLQATVLALLLLLATGVAGSDAAPSQPTSLSINAPTTANGSVGRFFSWDPIPNTAAFPLKAAVTAGTIPPGLTLDAAFGSIGGTPTAAGVSSVTVQITDADNNSGSATVTITIPPEITPLTITSARAITVTVGNPVSFNSLLN